MAKKKTNILIHGDKKCSLVTEPLMEYCRVQEGHNHYWFQQQAGHDYRAEWRIEGDVLQLIKMRPAKVIKLLFPKKRLPLTAYWYSGEMRIEEGKQVSIGFSKKYEQERIFTFVEGYMYLNELVDFRKDHIVHREVTEHTRREFSATHLEFIDAIHQHGETDLYAWEPQEKDAARLEATLIYADWLEEAGDPLAQVIREAVELNAPNADEPIDIRHSRLLAKVNKSTQDFFRLRILGLLPPGRLQNCREFDREWGVWDRDRKQNDDN